MATNKRTWNTQKQTNKQKQRVRLPMEHASELVMPLCLCCVQLSHLNAVSQNLCLTRLFFCLLGEVLYHINSYHILSTHIRVEAHTRKRHIMIFKSTTNAKVVLKYVTLKWVICQFEILRIYYKIISTFKTHNFRSFVRFRSKCQ